MNTISLVTAATGLAYFLGAPSYALYMFAITLLAILLEFDRLERKYGKK